MVFSSLIFLFFFLPILLALYFLLPDKYKNAVLIVFSLLFYSYGEPVYVLVMIFSTIVDYTVGRLIAWARSRNKNTKIYLLISIIVNLSMLGIFKYGDFAITNINSLIGGTIPLMGFSLPIGISFYTFQTMSYSIDVYRGRVEAQKSFADLLLYTTLFPQLVAGPIVRYSTIAEQINNRTVTLNSFSDGFCKFICGLSKKILIANSLASVADYVFGQAVTDTAVVTAWLGIIAYTFQIYFDFSGYSDMAIGLGRMFGFDFEINFNYPYISSSISEFWRRWHMSLGSWFRDYLYFPLGGSRVGKVRLIFNLFVVWGLTGLWHGASWNFVLWGLLFFVCIAVEKLSGINTKKYNPLGNIVTMLIVMLGWVFFRADTLTYAWDYIKNMFGQAGTVLYDYDSIYYFWQKLDVYILAFISSLPVLPFISKKLKNKVLTRTYNVITQVACVVLFAVCVIFLVNDSYNPFIYFRF